MQPGAPLEVDTLVEIRMEPSPTPAGFAFVQTRVRGVEPEVLLGERERAVFDELKKWPLRRSEWLAGRCVGKALLSRALGLEAGRVEILPKDSGAPALFVDGLERTDLVLNLTHTNAYAAAAVAPEPIGVDLCDLVDGRRLERIGRRVFSEGEVEACGAHRSTATQASVWAIKEAVLKLRIGGVFDPGARSVRVVSLEPPTVADGTRVVLYRLPEAMLAMATEGQGRRPRLR